jgi:hypothetical protein
MDDHDNKEGPLKAEALARDTWRGDGGTFLDESDAPGHTLPESERDRATQGGSGKKGSGAVSGTILPPD